MRPCPAIENSELQSWLNELWKFIELCSCKIQTGTYTGDGTTSQAITGLGFTPKYVKIWPHLAADTNYAGSRWDAEKSDGMTTQFASIDSGAARGIFDNYLISLDSDGFTVDDNGADSDPNKNGQTYDYLALG